MPPAFLLLSQAGWSGNQDDLTYMCLWQCLWTVVVFDLNNQKEVKN